MEVLDFYMEMSHAIPVGSNIYYFSHIWSVSVLIL